MFAKRTNWNLELNAITKLLNEKKQNGIAILDLTNSNSTKCGFEQPEILKLLNAPIATIYEPHPKGLLSAREAISDWHLKRGFQISPDSIILTSSASEAYSHLFKLLCNSGDNVLVPKPSYPLFEHLSEINDVRLQTYQLSYDGEWHINFETLNHAYTNATRAIIMVHPNNPTGSFIKPFEVKRISEFCSKHSIALISDEVFSVYAFKDTAIQSLLTLNVPIVFTINGLSKLAALPHLKLGWITVSGKKEFVSDALKRLEVISDAFLSVNTPVQIALPEILQQTKVTTEKVLDRLHSNYLTAKKILTTTPLSVLFTEGGWNAIIRFPSIMTDEQWVIKLLETKNVLIHPGHFFDLEGPYGVVSLLLPEDLFSKGMSTLRQFVCS